MEQYDRVTKIVAPKRIKLAEVELTENMACLKKTKDALVENEAKLENLQNQLKSTQNEKKRLEDEVSNCATKLERATKLIGGLAGEKDRWHQAAKYVEKLYDNPIARMRLKENRDNLHIIMLKLLFFALFQFYSKDAL
ncbi:unnamed protein product [Schistosoma mattheei]|uniref:Uncharacterized protein n=1 Tax=Schistosoma mattheei TaxID=31246 RepID=A0A183PCT2_9TREM|nr:unnamed protein product [Schistosoma mattheei]